MWWLPSVSSSPAHYFILKVWNKWKNEVKGGQVFGLRPHNHVREPRVWLRSALPKVWCIKFISLDSWHVLGCMWMCVESLETLCTGSKIQNVTLGSRSSLLVMWPGTCQLCLWNLVSPQPPVKRIRHPLVRVVSKWQWSLQKENVSSVFGAD